MKRFTLHLSLVTTAFLEISVAHAGPTWKPVYMNLTVWNKTGETINLEKSPKGNDPFCFDSEKKLPGWQQLPSGGMPNNVTSINFGLRMSTDNNPECIGLHSVVYTFDNHPPTNSDDILITFPWVFPRKGAPHYSNEATINSPDYTIKTTQYSPYNSVVTITKNTASSNGMIHKTHSHHLVSIMKTTSKSNTSKGSKLALQAKEPKEIPQVYGVWIENRTSQPITLGNPKSPDSCFIIHPTSKKTVPVTNKADTDHYNIDPGTFVPMGGESNSLTHCFGQHELTYDISGPNINTATVGFTYDESGGHRHHKLENVRIINPGDAKNWGIKISHSSDDYNFAHVTISEP